MSWQQCFVRSLRAASSASKRGSTALPACMQRSLPSNSIAATCSRSPATAAAPNASLASARAFQSSHGLPFSAASLLQQSRRSSQPSFPPPTSTQAVSTTSSCSVAAGTGGEGAAGSGLVGEGEDDKETLNKEPRTKPRPKEPPDSALVSTESIMHEMEAIPGSSSADGEHIFFLSRSQRVQRRLSREATAHLHHIVQVRESKLGALPRLRVGKEGLKKAFLASVADSLQAHGAVKVQVPRNSGLELGFVAFCLEASQDCIILGQKGNTLTAYRDTSLPRPPSTYVDSDTTFFEHQQHNRSYQHHPNSPHTVMHNQGAHEQHGLQQLARQQLLQQQEHRWAASKGSSTEAAGGECSEPLPALKRLDVDDELEEEQAGMGLRQLDFDDKLEGKEVGIQAGALDLVQGSKHPQQKRHESVARTSAASTADVEHRVTGMRGPGAVAAHDVVGSRSEQREPKGSRSSGGVRSKGLTPKPKTFRFNLGRVVG